jgi:membrane protease YdiL (CAAX protease family)
MFGIDPALISIVQFATVFGTAATVALCAATGVAVPVTALSSVGPPVAALLVAQFVGACGEELGWRCFLRPTLGSRAVPS